MRTVESDSRCARCTSDDEFKRELAEARGAMFQAGMNRVQGLAAEAIGTPATLMGPGMPPSVRLGAARTVAELEMHQHDADIIFTETVMRCASLRSAAISP